MSEEKVKYKKPLNTKSMSSRIWQREDCIYKKEVIKNILKMYFEECETALEQGEKIGLSNIGSLWPSVHTSTTYNVSSMNDEEGNAPYTSVRFNRSKINRQEMNGKPGNWSKRSMQPVMCGVGYYGSEDIYFQSKAFTRWHDMMNRCYALFFNLNIRRNIFLCLTVINKQTIIER